MPNFTKTSLNFKILKTLLFAANILEDEIKLRVSIRLYSVHQACPIKILADFCFVLMAHQRPDFCYDSEQIVMALGMLTKTGSSNLICFVPEVDEIRSKMFAIL